MDNSQDRIAELEDELSQVKRAAAVYVTEVLKDDEDEKVTRLRQGGNVTIRTDIKKIEKFEKPIMAQ